MQRLYFRHTRTQRRFEVVKLDKDKGVITLKGPDAGEFEEKYDKERFKRLGYILEKEDAKVPA